ncbi:MAG: DUF1648 domain-containing protein [Oligoflexia bacterium]|nr:DUF1648 domain-containing protein [Oligoflexia bacterium]
MGYCITYWPSLPEKVPMHFDFSGNPDAWGSKEWIFVIPAAGLLLYSLLSIISRFPQKFNYPVEVTNENRGRQYQLSLLLLSIVKLEILFGFTYITWKQIQVALEKSSGLDSLHLLTFLTILFGTIVWYLRKAKTLN